MYRDLSAIPNLGLMGIVMHEVMETAREMYQEFDLNRSRASILFSLHQHDSMSQKELAARLKVTPPSITSAIQKMEREGYITRSPDECDQRVMRLTLTEKGRSCIESVKNVADRMDEIIFRGMNQEEKLLFRRLILQIHSNLQEEDLKNRKHYDQKGKTEV